MNTLVFFIKKIVKLFYKKNLRGSRSQGGSLGRKMSFWLLLKYRNTGKIRADAGAA